MARIVPPRLNWPSGMLLLWANDVARRFVTGEFVWDPASINATTTVDTTLSDLTLYPELKGLRPGMPVFVTPPSTLNAGLIIGACWVATDDTLTIRLRNTSALSVDQASGTWGFQQFILGLLLYVLPATTLGYLSGVAAGNPEVVRDSVAVLASGAPRSDLKDIGRRQAGQGVSFAGRPRVPDATLRNRIGRVVRGRPDEQVVGAHTRADVAGVTGEKAVRNRAVRYLPGNSVRKSALAAVRSLARQRPISAWADVPSPQPAAVRFPDALPEALRRGGVAWSRNKRREFFPAPALDVVSSAKTKGSRWSTAWQEGANGVGGSSHIAMIPHGSALGIGVISYDWSEVI